MEYKVISSDSHMDITWLPGDLFHSNAPAQLKERVPRVVEASDGFRWKAGDKWMGVVGGIGNGYTYAKPGMSHRIDRMIDTGFFEEGLQGNPHPTTPELRSKDMDLDGVDAEVVYGILGMGQELKDPELVTVVYQIYNDWIADFCATDSNRWAGLACIPNDDPKVATAEVYRTAKLGLRGADFDVATGSKDLWDKEWDPFWSALQECNMPVSFHITGPVGRVNPFYELTGDERTDTLRQTVFVILLTSSAAEIIVTMILAGTLDRFSGLKFVLGEAGAGWIPYTLERMDLEYEDRFVDRQLKLGMKPSEYWYRQGHTTFQTEASGPRIVDLIGHNNILWGSDYPHPDGIWPDSHENIERDMGHLDEQVRRKIICENTGKLYGFIKG